MPGLRTAKPRALSRSEAIFARNLLSLNPIETVMPWAVSTRLASPARSWAGQAACSVSVPPRWRNASSIDKGSTNGVSRRISARTSRPTALYFAMSGRMTTASGQAPKALNIGIAERTP
jgi:hypothetical protein